MYAIFGLAILLVVLAEDRLAVEYTTRSKEDLQEHCHKFSNGTLWWQTNGYVKVPQDDNGQQILKEKSSVKFYGGLEQDDFFEGDGGLIGTSQILSDDGAQCMKKPKKTRLLVFNPAHSDDLP